MGKDLKGKELGTNLSQRKNGTYCARYIDEFGKRRYLYNTDLRQLKLDYAEAVYKTKNKLNIVDEKTTLDEWFNKWMFVYKSDLRKNSISSYSRIYRKHISPTLGGFYLSEVSKLQIQALIKELKSKDLGWETQNKVRVILTDMFARALEDNFVNKNPVKGVKTSSNKPKNHVKVLSTDEQALFFECASGTFYNNLFVVAVNTGLRPGELFALTKDNIDFENKVIRVTNTLVYQKYEDEEKKTFHLEEPKTRSSIRRVPINSICEIALKKQIVQKAIIRRRNIKETEFPDLLFTTKYNTPLNSVLYCAAIKRIIDEMNLTLDELEQVELISGHTLRHTFASRCIEAGVRPKTLQNFLGHSTLGMTMDLYVHNTEEAQKREMELFEEESSKISVSEDRFNEKYKKLTKEDNNIISFFG